MTISEKVAYLKGLAEGLNLDTGQVQGGQGMIGILEGGLVEADEEE